MCRLNLFALVLAILQVNGTNSRTLKSLLKMYTSKRDNNKLTFQIRPRNFIFWSKKLHVISLSIMVMKEVSATKIVVLYINSCILFTTFKTLPFLGICRVLISEEELKTLSFPVYQFYSFFMRRSDIIQYILLQDFVEVLLKLSLLRGFKKICISCLAEQSKLYEAFWSSQRVLKGS